LIRDPEIGLTRIADELSQDPALVARVLRLCNSAYFSAGREITDVRSAVARLGLQTVHQVVLASETFGHAEGLAVIEREFMQDRALRISRLAAKVLPGSSAEQASTAGLLVEVGRLLPPPQDGSLIPDYAQAGAYLLGLWGLPMPIVEAVAFHRQPRRMHGTGFWITGALHVAAGLVMGDPLDEAYLHSVGMLGKVPQWQALMEQDLARAAQGRAGPGSAPAPLKRRTPAAPKIRNGIETRRSPRLACTTKCRCGPPLRPVLPESPRCWPRRTRSPWRTRTPSGARCAYSAMLPSSCRMRTKFARSASPGRGPPEEKRASTCITTPSRAASTGVSSGTAKSTAWRFSASAWLDAPPQPWVTRSVRVASGHAYSTSRGRAPGWPGITSRCKGSRPCAMRVNSTLDRGGTVALAGSAGCAGGSSACARRITSTGPETRFSAQAPVAPSWSMSSRRASGAGAGGLAAAAAGAIARQASSSAAWRRATGFSAGRRDRARAPPRCRAGRRPRPRGRRAPHTARRQGSAAWPPRAGRCRRCWP